MKYLIINIFDRYVMRVIAMEAARMTMKAVVLLDAGVQK